MVMISAAMLSSTGRFSTSPMHGVEFYSDFSKAKRKGVIPCHRGQNQQFVTHPHIDLLIFCINVVNYGVSRNLNFR